MATKRVMIIHNCISAIQNIRNLTNVLARDKEIDKFNSLHTMISPFYVFIESCKC